MTRIVQLCRKIELIEMRDCYTIDLLVCLYEERECLSNQFQKL